MTPEQIESVAKVLADKKHKPVFDAAAALQEKELTSRMRNSIRNGDFHAAAMAEGELKALEGFYYAMKRLAKEG
jgi:hypothetical protein